MDWVTVLLVGYKCRIECIFLFQPASLTFVSYFWYFQEKNIWKLLLFFAANGPVASKTCIVDLRQWRRWWCFYHVLCESHGLISLFLPVNLITWILIRCFAAFSSPSCWISAAMLYNGMDLQHFASPATKRGIFFIQYQWCLSPLVHVYIFVEIIICITVDCILLTIEKHLTFQFFLLLAGSGPNCHGRGSIHPAISPGPCPSVYHRSRLPNHSTAWATPAAAAIAKRPSSSPSAGTMRAWRCRSGCLFRCWFWLIRNARKPSCGQVKTSYDVTVLFVSSNATKAVCLNVI